MCGARKERRKPALAPSALPKYGRGEMGGTSAVGGDRRTGHPENTCLSARRSSDLRDKAWDDGPGHRTWATGGGRSRKGLGFSAANTSGTGGGGVTGGAGLLSLDGLRKGRPGVGSIGRCVSARRGSEEKRKGREAEKRKEEKVTWREAVTYLVGYPR